MSESDNHSVKRTKSSSRRRKKRIKYAVILVFITAFIGLYFLYKHEKSTNNDLNRQITELKDENSKLTSQNSNAQSNNQSEDSNGLIVVFEPASVFTDQEKQDIKDKLVAPYSDFYPEKYAAFVIEVFTPDKYTRAGGDDKYIVTAVGKGDQESSIFLFGTKSKGISWWLPECLDKCEFSDQFKEKYPDLVAEYNKKH